MPLTPVSTPVSTPWLHIRAHSSDLIIAAMEPKPCPTSYSSPMRAREMEDVSVEGLGMGAAHARLIVPMRSLCVGLHLDTGSYLQTFAKILNPERSVPLRCTMGCLGFPLSVSVPYSSTLAPTHPSASLSHSHAFIFLHQESYIYYRYIDEVVEEFGSARSSAVFGSPRLGSARFSSVWRAVQWSAVSNVKQ